MAGARDVHRREESRYNKMLYIRKLEKPGELTQADYRILARRPEILGRKLALTIFGSVEAWGNDTRKNIALHIMKVFCGPMGFPHDPVQSSVWRIVHTIEATSRQIAYSDLDR